MKKQFFRWTAMLLAVLCLPILVSATAFAEPSTTDTDEGTFEIRAEEGTLNLDCKSAILMEATTGAVLYIQNADEALPPASVTKVMTLLLVMEAIDSGTVRMDNTVTVSANAASMGGSQVYLKEGEQMSVEDLLKSVVIASANDAAVALAEYLSGSVHSFVEKMNTRAKELGMANTRFENVTGLDDTAQAHLTSARDIALMSRALISHPTVLEYSSIWMDTIRDGAFGLTNTNRLVRFYKGCTGLKTGSTDKAGFCISATAERDGLSLICVIMGAETRDCRNAAATELLDWGFANFGIYRHAGEMLDPIPVRGGMVDACNVSYGDFSVVLPKRALANIKLEAELPQELNAPVASGEEIGRIKFLSGSEVIGYLPVCAAESIAKINFFEIFIRIFSKYLLI